MKAAVSREFGAQAMISARLAELGLSLPPAPQPVGAYRAAVVRGGLGLV
jgi:hypothetical protein